MSQDPIDGTGSDALRVAFAGGGTGGHLYPALAIREAIQRIQPSAEFIFFATDRPIDRRVLSDSDGEIVVQKMRPPAMHPWRFAVFLARLHRSRQTCRARFGQRRPSVVVGTGGYASVPAVLEAQRAGIPRMILNPDVLPGRANRYLSGRVDLVAGQWQESRAHLGADVCFEATGCPIRSDFIRCDRASGIRRFDLDPKRRTLLVTGASQGARSINDAVIGNASLLRSFDDWQVLHLTGEADFTKVVNAYRAGCVPAKVLPFTEEMADALAVADLVVSRAGASTLAELTALGRASILLPYPYDRHQHQKANAEVLARAGGAWIVADQKDPAANMQAVGDALRELMPDQEKIRQMAKNAQSIGNPECADSIASLLVELARQATPSSCDLLELAR